MELVYMIAKVKLKMKEAKLKELKFIPSASETPWSASDQVWQVSFTVLSFVLAILLSTLITYLFERPVARALRRKLGEKTIR